MRIDSLRSINLSNIVDDTVIFIDIDDTIITPKSNCFRYHSPGYHLIDDIKNNPPANFKDILSNWRLDRKTMLVEANWPNFINSLRQKNKVYALTQMNSGSIGNIKSMEEWRYNELKNIGINFTEQFADKDEKILLQGKESAAIFYRGIFTTGSYSKADVLEEYIKIHIPNKIIFIDDRESNIRQIAETCTKHNIDCITYLYRAIENLSYENYINNVSAVNIIDFQKTQLLNNGRWFEDELALKEILNKKNELYSFSRY